MGVFAFVLDCFSSSRIDNLRQEFKDDITSLESRLTKRIEESEQVSIGAVMLMIQDRYPGDERLVAHKIAAMAARTGYAGSHANGGQNL